MVSTFLVAICDDIESCTKNYSNQLQIFVSLFYFVRCEPCKILTPKLTELLEDNPDIDLAIVDVDTNIE